MSDCTEACTSVLASEDKMHVCGPYLRSGRIPQQQHDPDCDSDNDCSDGSSCIATQRGRECTTWEKVMVEMFKLGKKNKKIHQKYIFLLGQSCSSHDDCPEACHKNQCSPWL